MLIVNTDPSTGTLAYGDATYAADDRGLFEVPPELGAQLCAFPQWSEFDGSQPLADPSEPAEPAEAAADGTAEGAEPLPDGWADFRKPALIDLCVARGVDASGTVAEITARLDAWQAAPESEPESEPVPAGGETPTDVPAEPAEAAADGTAEGAEPPADSAGGDPTG